MHISEGILSSPALVGGGAAAVAGVAYALKKMDYDRVPQVAVVSGVFFVAALVHVPIGPSNAHLALNGLAGVLLGWAAFPAILVGLFLQAILFQFGGLTTLGVNTLNMALPAVVCGMAARRFIRSSNPTVSSMAAFTCGAGAVLLSGLMVAASLALVGESFRTIARIALIAHLPVMIIEGFMTVFLVGFLKKVKPETLEAHDAGSIDNEG
jgi:cobalt/nickel transport system permease protein